MGKILLRGKDMSDVSYRAMDVDSEQETLTGLGVQASLKTVDLPPVSSIECL